MDARRRSSRDCELAAALVRSSPLLGKYLPILRKCAAIVNRDDGSGVIVQRIIGNDPRLIANLNWIFSSMWMDSDRRDAPKLSEAVDLFGWSIVREIVLVTMLHEVHRDAAQKLGIDPTGLDRRALAVLTATVELGGSSVAGLFANVGEVGILLHDLAHGKTLSRQYSPFSDDQIAAERSAMGFDHAVLGSYMLSEVDFPPSVSEEVFDHTTVGTPIWIAEQLAADLGFGMSVEKIHGTHAIWQRLGFSDRRTERLQHSIETSTYLADIAFDGDALQVA